MGVKLVNNFAAIGQAIRRSLDEESEAAADLLVSEWQSRVHVVTGKYKRSIKKQKRGDKTYLVEAGVEYAKFEEYGTRYRPPHPAFEPAKEVVRREFPERTKKRIGSVR